MAVTGNTSDVSIKNHMRTYARPYATIGLVLLLVSGLSWWAFLVATPSVVEEPLPPTEANQITALAPVEPATLRIPAINLSTSFESPLGLEIDRTVAVPTDFARVGWYKYSPTPGELGPAIVLGHVHSKQGPAVFYDLKNVVVGDEILIDRKDGTIARFVVTEIGQYEQVAFPTDKVYGNIDHAGLRLITCAGTYDAGIERYTHNLVVYARLVP